MKITQQRQNSVSRIRPAGASAALALAVVLVLTVIRTQPAQAQTFTVLHSFDVTDGTKPEAGLVQATNGNLYGTTFLGGANNDGTVFEITPSGTLTTLYSFCSQSGCTDGYAPQAGLVLATNGDLYGTTYYGGANDDGTVFKITPSGTLSTLHSFDYYTDGAEPQAGLAQGANGNLYGTTEVGGANGYGTVFKITPSGTLTTLHSFAGYPEGASPYAGLVLATNGDFYGTTYGGGANSYGYGTVFKITPSGTLSTLHSFDVIDGYFPTAGLVQDTKTGILYGTTFAGGANSDGTVFTITPSGSLTTLHSFDGTDGAYPWAGLIQATDRNLYGTTYGGGANGDGTVFKITPSGSLTTLYSFCSQSSCTDGTNPVAALVQATSGDFYGTTEDGGEFLSAACPSGCGTVFSRSVGLGPFVELQSTSGKEGARIGILGQGFSSSSVVKFGGTQATTVASSGTTYLTATVPAAALTGSVTVTTGTTTLTSNQTFKVLPTITNFSPPSGPVGTPVTIMGTGLKQATIVKFGSVKATSFTVVSDTEVTTDVPTGAVTGKIAVTTKGGSATSATSFTVN